MACNGCSICDPSDPPGFGVIRLDPTLDMSYGDAKAHVMKQFQRFYVTILLRRMSVTKAAKHAKTDRSAIIRLRRNAKLP